MRHYDTQHNDIQHNNARIKGLYVTLSISDIQHNYALPLRRVSLIYAKILETTIIMPMCLILERSLGLINLTVKVVRILFITSVKNH
jgi:hypothetical protein